VKKNLATGDATLKSYDALAPGADAAGGADGDKTRDSRPGQPT
jgi:hypothetical protein